MIIESRKVCCLLPFMCLFYLFFSLTCSITDTLSPSQMIKDGETLTSKGETVELGFFSPGNSRNRYIGVWYKKALPDKKVVWVANRENPILDSSGVLTVHSSGNLLLLDGQQTTLWSTNAPRASANSIVVLLDTGNLVLSEKNSTQSGYLWQSFEHPSHTFLQGMKLRVNSKANGTHFIASWKSENDPSPGRFIAGFYDTQIPQLIVWNGSVRYWRSGPWNGNRFVGIPEMDSNYINGFRYNPDINEGPYISFFIFNDSYVLMPILDSSGSLKQMLLPEKEKRWTETWKAPKDECEIYGKCGFFGSCSISKTPICKCLRGFEPKVAEEWNKGNWTNGCMRRTQLQCNKNSSNQGENDGFIKLERTKLPDFSYYLNLNNQECKDECSRNCSCMAYSFADRIGCLVWGDYLIDVQEFSFGGEELYLRLAHSELDKEKKNRVLLVVLPIVGAIIFSALTIFTICWLKLNQRRKKKESVELVDKGKTIEMVKDSPKANLLNDGVRQVESPDLPLFDFRTIALATNNFSVANKLGQGGFGPVYKGRVQNGHEIAVKRLSRSSGQGLEEFMNEVKLISKLQHRNLVRLLGCCIEGEEKLLLYEYMPNGSLDAILFDATRRKLLDWSKRIHIVDGIARGLLYLHRDSRLRVIHRDLKASNILLDVDMNPKISDFGMARIFGGEQTIANTNRVVGTYGYMSPEYAMEGIFSEKSDVFSFGVLLLEIVSSKRCAGFYQSEQSLGFLGYAWKLWNEGKALELIDKTLVDSYSLHEFIRCIHVGLLSVQEHAVDRPNMSTILLMLGSETNLPMPKQPGFTLDRRYRNHDLSFDDNNGIVSMNSVTVTSLKGR